jgi:hypothetical protein
MNEDTGLLTLTLTDLQKAVDFTIFVPTNASANPLVTLMSPGIVFIAYVEHIGLQVPRSLCLMEVEESASKGLATTWGWHPEGEFLVRIDSEWSKIQMKRKGTYIRLSANHTDIQDLMTVAGSLVELSN